MEIWRMEDERGRGPFDGTPYSVLSELEWDELLAANVGQSVRIRETLDPFNNYAARARAFRLEVLYGKRPIYGAPDRECFERWFPLRFRRLYATRGFEPVVYDVPEDAVRMGGSSAECVFVPIGPKRRVDPETLELLDEPPPQPGEFGADWGREVV